VRERELCLRQLARPELVKRAIAEYCPWLNNQLTYTEVVVQVDSKHLGETSTSITLDDELPSIELGARIDGQNGQISALIHG
jgi:hypothetical protein